jgi:formamidopyrimidine-DNA glycosylase
MPELPEVETVRRGLEPVLAGARIARAEVRRPDLRWPLPGRLAERLTGRRVERLGRRSKYILADLDGGPDGGETLILHLGMSGRILIGGAEQGAFAHVAGHLPQHDHIVLDTGGGARIVFNDARRFGMVDLVRTPDAPAHRLLAGLGPEPLGNDFHEDHLAAALAGRRSPVKAVLLDQATVAGLGNIYVSEALWRAGIPPTALAGSIARHRLAALVAAIRSVLAEAIAAGGSSLRDHRQASGELGYFQHSFAVYDRAGQPCPRPGCQGTIARVVQSARSSYYCPVCQKP